MGLELSDKQQRACRSVSWASEARVGHIRPRMTLARRSCTLPPLSRSHLLGHRLDLGHQLHQGSQLRTLNKSHPHPDPKFRPPFPQSGFCHAFFQYMHEFLQGFCRGFLLSISLVSFCPLFQGTEGPEQIHRADSHTNA